MLLLTELFPPAVGGTPVLFEEVYSRLRGPGVTVLADDAVGAGTAESTVRHGGMTTIRRPMRSTEWGLLDVAGLRNHLRVARLVRTLSADRDVVVHCGRALPEGVAAWLNRLRGGAPYVCWAHGEDVAAARQSRELTWLITRVFAGASAAIANSRNTRAMVEGLGIAAEKIHVVHPGVDVQRFHPGVDGSAIRERFAPDGGIVLLSVGRLQRRKGHDLAIEAVSRIDRSLRLRYLIAGNGEERARLEALAEARQVTDRVQFVGEVESDVLPQYYAASDVFVMPNRIDGGDVEGFGIVFLEAAATARAAIGGNSGGVPEAIVDGETGVLVSGTDADELARAIAQMAESETRRRALGAAGRARACRDFTWERAAGQVEAIHAAVSSTRRGRHGA